MEYRMIVIGLAVVMDFLLGDPHSRWHPICWIGNAISWLEKKLRVCLPKTPYFERIGGGILVLGILFLTGSITVGILTVCYHISVWFGVAVETVCCYFMLAARSLRDESMKVFYACQEGDVEKARYAVSMIVGRDTSVLTEEGIQKAAVETVAENTSDGEVAPLFYMALFGGLGAVLYKAANTMDSMVAYKNEKYLYFGWAAAKLDDVLNWIPSRLAALLMVTAAWILEWMESLGFFRKERSMLKSALKESIYSGKQAWKIWRRDKRNHKSPNSAQTEAACAGALQLQLAGPAWYFGKYYEKPLIGDPIRQIEAEDIVRANTLMYTTTLLTVLFFMILLWIV